VKPRVARSESRRDAAQQPGAIERALVEDRAIDVFGVAEVLEPLAPADARPAQR